MLSVRVLLWTFFIASRIHVCNGNHQRKHSNKTEPSHIKMIQMYKEWFISSVWLVVICCWPHSRRFLTMDIVFAWRLCLFLFGKRAQLRQFMNEIFFSIFFSFCISVVAFVQLPASICQIVEMAMAIWLCSFWHAYPMFE